MLHLFDHTPCSYQDFLSCHQQIHNRPSWFDLCPTHSSNRTTLLEMHKDLGYTNRICLRMAGLLSLQRSHRRNRIWDSLSSNEMVHWYPSLRFHWQDQCIVCCLGQLHKSNCLLLERKRRHCTNRSIFEAEEDHLRETRQLHIQSVVTKISSRYDL